MSFRVKKVIFLGNSGVGKSTILAKYLNTPGEVSATISVDPLNAETTYLGHKLDLSIWDTSGATRYRCLQPMYMRESNCAVLVFDMTDRASFEALEGWYQEACEHGIHNFVAVANKSDLEPQVSYDQAKEWCKSRNIRLIRTSAASGSNITHLVHVIGEVVANDEPDVIETINIEEDCRLKQQSSGMCKT